MIATMHPTKIVHKNYRNSTIRSPFLHIFLWIIYLFLFHEEKNIIYYVVCRLPADWTLNTLNSLKPWSLCLGISVYRKKKKKTDDLKTLFFKRWGILFNYSSWHFGNKISTHTYCVFEFRYGERKTTKHLQVPNIYQCFSFNDHIQLNSIRSI